MRFALTAFATLIAVSAAALDVVFDERSPKENCEWVDKSHVREQMVVVAAKISKVPSTDKKSLVVYRRK